MDRPSIVFLDRDGTIIEDAHYPSDPDAVKVLPGAAGGIARFNAEGIPVVVVTNQSGIGRGYYSLQEYERVNERLVDLLDDDGALLDAIFFCPHAPDESPPCPCRKPGTALFVEALTRFGAAPQSAVYIGDRVRDVSPALVLGGTAFLIVGPDTSADDVEWAEREARTANSLADAVDQVLGPY